uniref:SCAN box domain-containing protein n=1 Tax=Crocodylus porosus TaxID=8502 RepID=A0A7M4EU34_CROPO
IKPLSSQTPTPACPYSGWGEKGRTSSAPKEYRAQPSEHAGMLRDSETYRQKFWAKKGPQGDLPDQWLRPEEHTSLEIVDKIVLKQFLMDLTGSTQRWAWCHQTKMVGEALCLAEDYGAAEGEGETPKKREVVGLLLPPG